MPISDISAASRSASAWFGLVLPSLLINYFGQGALVLADPEAIENPFYRLVPDPLLIPMVVLATAATVIASQAVITGAYSLVQQAIQLGFLPRVAIVHTSEDQYGQIYIPRVNTILLVGVLLLVLMFRSSSALASAYGIAVATTMVVDGLLGFIVIWKLWKWKWWQAALLILPFVLIDSMFLSANMLKLFDGAWVPLLFAGLMVLLMWTWRRGTRILANKTRKTEVPLDTAAAQSREEAAAFCARHCGIPDQRSELGADRADAQSQAQQDPARAQRHPDDRRPPIRRGCREEDRVSMTPVSSNFLKVTLNFGYMEQPNVPKALAIARKQGWSFDIMSTSFFLSRRALKPSATFGHADLAGSPVHRAGQERERRHRLLPDSDRTGGRGRHAGDGINARVNPLSRCFALYKIGLETGPKTRFACWRPS